MTQAGTVHVIDDDAPMRDSLRLLLEASGFAVRTHDGARAFLTDIPTGPGCVLTDVRMPEIDGLELLKRMHDHHVRLRRPDAGQGLLRIGSIAANGQVRLPVDQLPQAFAEHGVVVHEEYAALGHRVRAPLCSVI